MYVFGGKVLVLSALARAMSRNGYKVHVSHVSRVLKGERAATKEFIAAMALVLGMTKKEAERLIIKAQEANRDYSRLPKLVVED
jgi:hypothetical protein